MRQIYNSDTIRRVSSARGDGALTPGMLLEMKANALAINSVEPLEGSNELWYSRESTKKGYWRLAFQERSKALATK